MVIRDFRGRARKTEYKLKISGMYSGVNLSYHLEHSLGVLAKPPEIAPFASSSWLNLQGTALTGK